MTDVLKEPSKFDLVVSEGMQTPIHTVHCDSCKGVSYSKARAFKVTLETVLELYFCAHHIRKNHMYLSLQGFEIEDPLNEINYGNTPDPYAAKVVDE